MTTNTNTTTDTYTAWRENWHYAETAAPHCIPMHYRFEDVAEWLEDWIADEIAAYGEESALLMAEDNWCWTELHRYPFTREILESMEDTYLDWRVRQMD